MAYGVIARKTLYQSLQLLLLILGFITLGAWVADLGRPEVLWALRLGAPAAAIPVAWELFSVWRHLEIFPDFLRELAGTYFEQKGLCFAPIVELAAGQPVLAIYFQNRYSGRAITHIRMRPPLRSFRLTRHPLPSIAVDIECPGGAFGILRIPFPIPQRYQGKHLTFDIAADTRYPDRRGDLLRLRQGKRISATRELGAFHEVAGALLTLLLGILGPLLVQGPARARLDFPNELPPTPAPPPDSTPTLKILWLPTPPSVASSAPPRNLAA